MDATAVSAALRRIARGFDDLADAISQDNEEQLPVDQRVAKTLVEWGERGLTREEASVLFRKHGFAPQAAGAWARDDWIETRDGLRYVTERSRQWLGDRESR